MVSAVRRTQSRIASSVCACAPGAISSPVTSFNGDVAISDDGKLLIVATERLNGSLVIFDLTDPRHPRQLSRLATQETYNGVHTAEVGRINGRLYAILAIDALSGAPTPESKVVIVDLADPANPQQIFVKAVPSSAPFVHDSFLRDGLLFVALWNAGVEIWDVGGGAHGGTPNAPVVIGSVATIGGDVHNIWWLHDPLTGSRYAFVGEESGPAVLGVSSAGDIHVLDVSDLTHPREVAFYHVPSAGTHNFSVDETNGVLYAAYYNAGVRALDVHGDLETCDVSAEFSFCSLSCCWSSLFTATFARSTATLTATTPASRSANAPIQRMPGVTRRVRRRVLARAFGVATGRARRRAGAGAATASAANQSTVAKPTAPCFGEGMR